MRSCGGGSGGWVLHLPQHCFDPHSFVAVVGQEFALNESRLAGFCGLALGIGRCGVAWDSMWWVASVVCVTGAFVPLMYFKSLCHGNRG